MDARRGEYYVQMRSTAPRKLDDWLGRSRQWPKKNFNELNRNMKNFHNFAINTLKVYPYILLKYIFERLWCIQRIYWKLPLGEYENSESSEISETSETSDKMRWCPSFPSFPSFSFRVFVLHYRKWGVFTKILTRVLFILRAIFTNAFDCCLLFGLYQSQATLVWTSIGFKYFFSARKISTRKVSLLGRFT